MKRTIIKDIKKINTYKVRSVNGTLNILEQSINNLFSFKRLFWVNTKQSIRGNHAHKKCHQLLFCQLGKIELLCDDGLFKKKFILRNNNYGIYVPPGIWSTQNYLEKKNILLVFCSHNFEEKEYIRNYQIFKKYKT